MSRILAVFALLLFFIPVQTNAQTHKAKKTAKSEQPDPAALPAAAQQINSPTPKPENQEHVDADVRGVSVPEKADEKPARWYAPFQKPDWWLVLIAAATGGVIGWQSWETRKAAQASSKQAELMKTQLEDARTESAASASTTKATLDALKRQGLSMRRQTTILRNSASAAENGAGAALLNARAVFNAERPWVFVSISPFEHDPEIFRVIAENKGRTPAFIIEGSIGFVTAKGLDHLPAQAPYTRDTLVRGRFLLPDKTALIYGVSRKALKAALKDTFPKFPGDGQVYIVGQLTYRDLLGTPGNSDIHETRWINWYQMSDEGDEVTAVEGVGLPTEYERYT